MKTTVLKDIKIQKNVNGFNHKKGLLEKNLNYIMKIELKHKRNKRKRKYNNIKQIIKW